MKTIDAPDRIFKLCPFCGEEAQVSQWRDESHRSHAEVVFYKVECSCGASSMHSEDLEEVLSSWNTRADDDHAAEVERHDAAVKAASEALAEALNNLVAAEDKADTFTAENAALKEELDKAKDYARRLRESINGTGPADVDYMRAMESDLTASRARCAELEEVVAELDQETAELRTDKHIVNWLGVDRSEVLAAMDAEEPADL